MGDMFQRKKRKMFWRDADMNIASSWVPFGRKLKKHPHCCVHTTNNCIFKDITNIYCLHTRQQKHVIAEKNGFEPSNMNNRQRIKHAPTYSESLEILQGNKKKIKEVRIVERDLIINSSTMAGATLSRSCGFRVNPTVFETGSMYRTRAFNWKKNNKLFRILPRTRPILSWDIIYRYTNATKDLHMNSRIQCTSL